MQIKSYRDINVNLIRKTDRPIEIVILSLSITMKKDYNNYIKSYDRQCKLIKKVLLMGHATAFENVVMTFLITGGSRNFLAQITRHRIGTFASASQHYQNYKNYGAIFCPQMQEHPKVIQFMANMMDLYNQLVSEGIPHEEVRQILCGGMENNLLWTVNARSLINFLNLRLCERNTLEMKTVASKVRDVVIEYFPELFSYVGADCFMYGKCRQGDMSCKKNH